MFELERFKADTEKALRDIEEVRQNRVAELCESDPVFQRLVGRKEVLSGTLAWIAKAEKAEEDDATGIEPDNGEKEISFPDTTGIPGPGD